MKNIELWFCIIALFILNSFTLVLLVVNINTTSTEILNLKHPELNHNNNYLIQGVEEKKVTQCQHSWDCIKNMNLTGCYRQECNFACCYWDYCEITQMQCSYFIDEEGVKK